MLIIPENEPLKINRHIAISGSVLMWCDIDAATFIYNISHETFASYPYRCSDGPSVESIYRHLPRDTYVPSCIKEALHAESGLKGTIAGRELAKRQMYFQSRGN